MRWYPAAFFTGKMVATVPAVWVSSTSELAAEASSNVHLGKIGSEWNVTTENSAPRGGVFALNPWSKPVGPLRSRSARLQQFLKRPADPRIIG
jgi:hypothetical protein